MKLKYLFIVIAISLSLHFQSQITKFGFELALKESPDRLMPFMIKNDGAKTLENLISQKIRVKYLIPEWIYVTCTPKDLEKLMSDKLISDFHYEFHQPTLMNDSTRLKHFVNEVHAGSNGLPMAFTGKDVIVGVIDVGLDVEHPDFNDENGNSRVLFYWDQTLASTTNFPAPAPYAYGREFTSLHINNGVLDTLYYYTSHGTLSSGIAAGNGLASGNNKGMAPESKIIFVNYYGSNASITDGVDYIFKKADALGLPCVINISIGDYLGSHDAKDPNSLFVESLLNAKKGRAIVVSAGNSGVYEPYHVKGIVNSNTSFVWFKNNTNTSPYTGTANTVLFDLWSNTSDIQNVSYSYGANKTSGTYEERGTTNLRNSLIGLSGELIDTLKNSQGNRLAIIKSYPIVENGRFNLLTYFQIDSINYNYSFKTTGSGSYDLWSSASAGILLNKIVDVLPTVLEYPQIVNYQAPDLQQSIVSGLACSEKVITVGNIVNQTDYIAFDGNLVTIPVGFFSHILSPNSSKGPTRLGVVKPDITAAGDYSFAPGVLEHLSNPGNFNKVSQDGWHLRAGGTSASGPVVAGIAALYFERCSNSNYADLMSQIKTNAYTDQFTGAVPNNSYGAGKIHALNTLLAENYTTSIIGSEILCNNLTELSVTSSEILDSVVWSFGTQQINSQILGANQIGPHYAYFYNSKACIEVDSIVIIQGSSPSTPVITLNGIVLSSTAESNYQWYYEGNPLNGQTFQSLIGSVNPTGQYWVSTSNSDGCSAISNIYQGNVGLKIDDSKIILLKIYPNPTSDFINIESKDPILEIIIHDVLGKELLRSGKAEFISLMNFTKGIYFVNVKTEFNNFLTKIERY
jgi:hypothetical protein